MSERFSSSIEKGLGYLIRTQESNGLWMENFGLRHGESTSWSTAYVGRLLYDAGYDLRDLNRTILLNLQDGNGGWKFNSSVPVDSDTTINVLLYLQGLLPEDKYARGLNLVLDYQLPSGGMVPWTAKDVEDMGYSGSGWSAPHSCITALFCRIAPPENLEAAKNFLETTRLPDGSWPSYWWVDRMYTTLECVRIFGVDSEMKKYIREVAPTSAFGLGLKIQGLVAIEENFADEVSQLIGWQQPDGAWGPSDVIKVPNPQITDEILEGVRTAPDNKRTFSTASAVLALIQAEEAQ